MAPELLKNQEYSFKVDIWAAMVVIYVLFTKKLPFDGPTLWHVHQDVKEMKIDVEL